MINIMMSEKLMVLVDRGGLQKMDGARESKREIVTLSHRLIILLFMHLLSFGVSLLGLIVRYGHVKTRLPLFSDEGICFQGGRRP